MAYAYTVNYRNEHLTNNKKHITYSITETDVGVADEALIDRSAAGGAHPLPAEFFFAYYQSDLTTAGVATTVQPEVGKAAGWTTDDADHLASTAVAAANVKNRQNVRCDVPGQQLWIRSTPDANATRIDTLFTIVEGVVE